MKISKTDLIVSWFVLILAVFIAHTFGDIVISGLKLLIALIKDYGVLAVVRDFWIQIENILWPIFFLLGSQIWLIYIIWEIFKKYPDKIDGYKFNEEISLEKSVQDISKRGFLRYASNYLWLYLKWAEFGPDVLTINERFIFYAIIGRLKKYKKYEWYGLPVELRADLLKEHFPSNFFEEKAAE